MTLNYFPLQPFYFLQFSYFYPVKVAYFSQNLSQETNFHNPIINVFTLHELLCSSCAFCWWQGVKQYLQRCEIYRFHGDIYSSRDMRLWPRIVMWHDTYVSEVQFAFIFRFGILLHHLHGVTPQKNSAWTQTHGTPRWHVTTATFWTLNFRIKVWCTISKSVWM